MREAVLSSSSEPSPGGAFSWAVGRVDICRRLEQGKPAARYFIQRVTFQLFGGWLSWSQWPSVGYFLMGTLSNIGWPCVCTPACFQLCEFLNCCLCIYPASGRDFSTFLLKLNKQSLNKQRFEFMSACCLRRSEIQIRPIYNLFSSKSTWAVYS